MMQTHSRTVTKEATEEGEPSTKEWPHGFDSEKYPLLPSKIQGDVQELRHLHRSYIAEHYRKCFYFAAKTSMRLMDK